MKITSINNLVHSVRPIRTASFDFRERKAQKNCGYLSQPAFDTVEFKGANKKYPPFYTVKLDGTERKRFETPLEASFALRIDSSGITYCLEGGNRTKEYFVIRADLVEDTKEDGSTELNEAKFEKIFNEKKSKLPADVPVYVVATDKSKRKRYDGINLAAQGLSTSRTAILNCLSGKRRMTSHSFVIAAESVENTKEDGSFELDEDKFEIEFQKRLAILNENAPVATPVYIAKIDDIKQVKRFDDINLAASFISTNRDNIVSCLKGRSRRTGEYFVFLASDIEEIQEDGSIKPNGKKYRKLYQEKLEALNSKKTRKADKA